MSGPLCPRCPGGRLRLHHPRDEGPGGPSWSSCPSREPAETTVRTRHPRGSRPARHWVGGPTGLGVGPQTHLGQKAAFRGVGWEAGQRLQGGSEVVPGAGQRKAGQRSLQGSEGQDQRSRPRERSDAAGGTRQPVGQEEAVNVTPAAPSPPAVCVGGEASLLGCTFCPPAPAQPAGLCDLMGTVSSEEWKPHSVSRGERVQGPAAALNVASVHSSLGAAEPGSLSHSLEWDIDGAGLAPWAPDFCGVHCCLGCVDGSLFLKLPSCSFYTEFFCIAEPVGDLWTHRDRSHWKLMELNANYARRGIAA